MNDGCLGIARTEILGQLVDAILSRDNSLVDFVKAFFQSTEFIDLRVLGHKHGLFQIRVFHSVQDQSQITRMLTFKDNLQELRTDRVVSFQLAHQPVDGMRNWFQRWTLGDLRISQSGRNDLTAEHVVFLRLTVEVEVRFASTAIVVDQFRIVLLDLQNRNRLKRGRDEFPDQSCRQQGGRNTHGQSRYPATTEGGQNPDCREFSAHWCGTAAS